MHARYFWSIALPSWSTTRSCMSLALMASDLWSETSGGRGGDIGMHHFCWINDPIELGLRNEAQLQGGRLEREVVVHGVVRDLRRLVVADHRRQRRHEHQRT